VQRSIKVTDNQEYMASDRWKCSKSPSGAHHWMIHSGEMICKYCELIKPMDTKRYGWTKSETK
jgi:hypothetical protein